MSVESLEDRCVPAVFNVNSLADVLNPAPGVVTLRSAIQAADNTADPNGNVINLTVPGTYRITLAPNGNEVDNQAGEFMIAGTNNNNSNLTILNTSGGKVAIDGNNLARVFDIEPAFNFAGAIPAAKLFTVTLGGAGQGFTIENGRAFDATGNAPDGPDFGQGGGIRDVGPVSLTLNDLVIANNSATADGGGVGFEDRVSTPWTLTVNNSIIRGNKAGDAGGGIDVDGHGKVFVNNSTITGNATVNQGGGIWLDAVESNGVFQTSNLTVTNSVISNNTSLTANAAANDGGGIGNAGDGTVTITGSTIAHNFTGGVGGGFGDANGVGTLVVVNSTFADNVAVGKGGGIEASGPMTTITNATITGNQSLDDGGGLAVSSPAFTLNNSIVAEDFAGPANFVGNGGMVAAVTVTNGGAGYTTAPTVTFSAPPAGGTQATGTATIDAGVVTAITITNPGAGYVTPPTITIGAPPAGGTQATAVADVPGLGADVFAALTAGSNDFIGIGDANLTGITAGTNGNHVGTAAQPLSPDLGPLQDNGGLTPTEAPLAGSPVIDAVIGGPLPAGTQADQRGFLRVVGTAQDIGAVEFQPPATTLMLTASQPTVNIGQPVTFTATVTAQTANSNPPQGAVTFFVDGVAQAPVALVNGVASLTLAALPFGPHSVAATYSGDVNFSSSTAAVGETVLGLQDVTHQVSVTMVTPVQPKHGKKGKMKQQHGKKNPLQQTLRVLNISGSAITGPLYLVLDGLGNRVKLTNTSGASQTHVRPGDPFVVLTQGTLGAGQSVTVTLNFTPAMRKMMVKQVNFNTFVLAGPGTV
jgi:hypothetical protein